MKKIRIVLALALTLFLLLVAAAGCAESYAEAYTQITDRQVYQGTWQNAYLQILQVHSAGIRDYENRKIEFTENGVDYAVPCYPVGLVDLTGDGIPELYFMEITADEGSGEARGDLLVYSADGSTATCVLQVQGLTWPEYDPMLGFEMYLTPENGLIIRHYLFELPCTLQFDYSSGYGLYQLRNVLVLEEEMSGESEDRYYLNDAQVSAGVYEAVKQDLESRQAQCVSAFFTEQYQSYGFNYTWEKTAEVLGGQAAAVTAAPVQTVQTVPKEIYGYTIDKLATRKGPGTRYDGGGTYSVKGQYIKVLAKAWDKRNGIWWVKCEIPYKKEIRVLWTGYKRFDSDSLNLDDLPEEVW